MRQSAILFILFLVTITSQSQTLQGVKKVLNTCSFSQFEKYMTNPNGSKELRFTVWEQLRDITPKYKEGVCYFEKSVPDKNNAAISTVYTYRVTFITKDDIIIYYQLSEKKYNQRKREQGIYTEDIYFEKMATYKNEKMVNRLKASFKQTFSAELNMAELFIENIVYGSGCGFVGKDPNEKTMIDNFVKNKDRNSLTKWMQSTNTEKQIYALDGFYQLKRGGLKLTEQENKMIKAVLSKQGTIHTCSGCTYLTQQISSITKEFIF